MDKGQEGRVGEADRATAAAQSNPQAVSSQAGIPHAAWVPSDTNELAAALAEFRKALPGWWFTVGECSVSADASCGPDRAGPDAALLRLRSFDDGFHADLPQPSSMADALRNVTAQAIEARRAETAQTGSVHESAVRQDGPNPSPTSSNSSRETGE